MKKVIVYHDTETKANRARKPRVGETLAYRSIDKWDEKENDKYDEVINLSAPKVTKAKKVSSSKGKAEI